MAAILITMWTARVAMIRPMLAFLRQRNSREAFGGLLETTSEECWALGDYSSALAYDWLNKECIVKNQVAKIASGGKELVPIGVEDSTEPLVCAPLAVLAPMEYDKPQERSSIPGINKPESSWNLKSRFDIDRANWLEEGRKAENSKEKSDRKLRKVLQNPELYINYGDTMVADQVDGERKVLLAIEAP
ncbi:hypothetical protein F0562_024099 [Nyssa sinensis]|uniref:Uncharacterized protein n=1 Tax=Nyssa sinensis TaxID=561372 RepID=A0A5J5BMF4_9ASTE|nr:hypothetical protein F0562_024099 [Nyssa sinensis]